MATNQQDRASVQAQYAQLVRAALRRAGLFEAEFDIHGAVTNSGFYILTDRTDRTYLSVAAVVRSEPATSILRPAFKALRSMLKGVVPANEIGYLVYDQQATRHRPYYTVVAAVPEPRVVAALQRHASQR